MVAEQRLTTLRIVSGIWAGVVASIVMGAILCIHSAAVGLGALFPLQIMSGTFYGAESILGGFGPTIVGLITHLVGSAIFGIIFSALLPRHTLVNQAIGGGLAFGLAVWAFLTFVDLPVMNHVMSERTNLIPGWWFLSCMAYGATLGITPMIRDRYMADTIIRTYEPRRHPRAA